MVARRWRFIGLFADVVRFAISQAAGIGAVVEIDTTVPFSANP